MGLDTQLPNLFIFLGETSFLLILLGVINSFRGQQLSQQILDAIGASWKRPAATGNRFAVHEFLTDLPFMSSFRKLCESCGCDIWYVNEQGLNFGFWKDNLIQVICTVHVGNVVFVPRPGIKTWDVQQCPKNSCLFKRFRTVLRFFFRGLVHSIAFYGWIWMNMDDICLFLINRSTVANDWLVPYGMVLWNRIPI